MTHNLCNPQGAGNKPSQPMLPTQHDSLGKMSLLNRATMLNRLLDNKPRMQLR